MAAVRASSIPQLAGIPYRLLTDLEFIRYEEGTPTENARKLNEHEVDIALIPVVDFASHGGYMSLEFGMGTRRRTDSMVLYSHKPVEALRAVHIYECSSSSMMLLKLLLAEKWKTSPALLRREEFEPFEGIGQDDGVLALHELPGMRRSDFPVAEDLGTAWYKHTGLPFVFLVWAARPGVLGTNELLVLNQTFHRAAKASKEVARQYAEEFGTSPELSAEFVGDNRRYYLDHFMLSGLEEFLLRARSLGLLPPTAYQYAKANLLIRKPVASIAHRNTTEILNELLDGHRLSIEGGLHLAEHASISDLQSTAKAVASLRGSAPKLLAVMEVDANSLEHTALLKRKLNDIASRGLKWIRLALDEEQISDLDWFEGLIKWLAEESDVAIEAGSVWQLNFLATRHGIDVREVVVRLVQSGLKCLGGTGGGMLVSGRGEHSLTSPLPPGEWVGIIRIVHAIGLKSSCCLRLSPEDSWEERLLHLQKLRTLQDENPGFDYFYLEPSPKSEAVSAELQSRAMLLSRLFLDNVCSFREETSILP